MEEDGGGWRRMEEDQRGWRRVNGMKEPKDCTNPASGTHPAVDASLGDGLARDAGVCVHVIVS